MRTESQEACRERIHWMCRQVVGANALDYGCSQGVLAALLGRAGVCVTGVDIDPHAVAFAEKALEAEPESVRRLVSYRVVPAGRLPFADASFDTVILGEVLEHQSRVESVLAEARRVLRPGGRVVITVPFGRHPHPEHIQTYFVGRLLDELAPYFQPLQVELVGRYICFVGAATDRADAGAAPLDWRELLRATERVVAHVQSESLMNERRLRDRIEKLEATERETQRAAERIRATLSADQVESHELAESLAAARQRQVEALIALARAVERWDADPLGGGSNGRPDEGRLLAAKLGALASTADAERMLPRLVQESVVHFSHVLGAARRRHVDEVQALQVEIEQLSKARQEAADAVRSLRTRLDGLSEQLAYTREVLDVRLNEVRYQLGDALVRAAYHPKDLLLAPFRVARLFWVGMRKRRGRQRAEHSSGVAASPPSAFAATVDTEALPTGDEGPAAIQTLSFPPAVRRTRPIKLAVTAASVLDEFTHECFQGELHLMPPTPDNWRDALQKSNPDLLFVESAWKGNGGAWRGCIERAAQQDQGPLVNLVGWCNDHRIPTVFWNKEDPPNFEHFIYAASKFAYIFTTDENCVPAYRRRVRHNRIFALPFAAQPDLHNPIGSRGDKIENFCFAGTYYNRKHSDRRDDMEILLRPAMERGLHIFDRMHGFQANNSFRWPDPYQSAIRGGLPYAEMVTAYKNYRVFLNVNSVKDSPTMFSRRVLELLACGTPVVSTYSLGIDRLLGRDCVALVESEEEARQWMDDLLRKPELGEQMVLRAQRRIFREHTYEQRVRTILEKLGIPAPAPDRRVCVVVPVDAGESLFQALENVARQTCHDVEVVLALHESLDVPSEAERIIRSMKSSHVVRIPSAPSAAECWRLGLEHSTAPYLARFEARDYYGPDYLSDLLTGFLYADAEAIGKGAIYRHDPGSRAITLHHGDLEHGYIEALSDSALIASRALVSSKLSRLEPTDGFWRSAQLETNFYSADRFNYVLRPAADQAGSAGASERDGRAAVVTYSDDFRCVAVV